MFFVFFLLETISPQQRKLQEAKFELITSEASYLRSLNVLTTHFIQSREFAGDSGSEALLSRLERHTLFSDIVPVRECSEALLADLEQRWQENVFIREICDILLEHASKHFEVYIKYCTNQLYQERMLRDLKYVLKSSQLNRPLIILLFSGKISRNLWSACVD